MEFEIKENVLTLNYSGKISSNNLHTIETDTFSIIESHPHSKLILDMKKLDYISSAGLRLILKLSKKEPDFLLCNVNASIFEILSVTGFSDILKIEHAKKFIDLDNCELIGTGYFSKVYRIDEDKIVKVFKNNFSIDRIEYERKNAKQAFIAGFPCVIPYDIVDTKDGYGLVFEALNYGCLQNEYWQCNSEDKNKMLISYVELIKKINNTEPLQSDKFPCATNVALDKLEFIKDMIEEDFYESLKSVLHSVENRNTFVHSDCHLGNIMRCQDDLILVDMESLAVGNPIFELDMIYCHYIGFNEFNPMMSTNVHKLSVSEAKDFFDKVLHLYFYDKLEDTIQRNLKRIQS